MKELYKLTKVTYRLKTIEGNSEEIEVSNSSNTEIRYGFSPKNNKVEFKSWEELSSHYGKNIHEKGKLKGQEYCYLDYVGMIEQKDFINLEVEFTYLVYEKEEYPSLKILSEKMKFWELMELIHDTQKTF